MHRNSTKRSKSYVKRHGQEPMLKRGMHANEHATNMT